MNLFAGLVEPLLRLGVPGAQGFAIGDEEQSLQALDNQLSSLRVRLWNMSKVTFKVAARPSSLRAISAGSPGD